MSASFAGLTFFWVTAVSVVWTAGAGALVGTGFDPAGALCANEDAQPNSDTQQNKIVLRIVPPAESSNGAAAHGCASSLL